MKEKVKTVKVPRGIVDMYFNIAVEEATQKGLKFTKSHDDPVIQKIMHKHLLNWYEDSVVPSVKNPSTQKVSLDKIEGFDDLFSDEGLIGQILRELGARNPKQYVTAIKGSVMHLSNVYLELGMKLGKDAIRRASTFGLEPGDKAPQKVDVFHNRLYRATMTVVLLSMMKKFYQTDGNQLKKEIERLFPSSNPKEFASPARRNEYLQRLAKRLEMMLADFSVVQTMKTINLDDIKKGTQE